MNRKCLIDNMWKSIFTVPIIIYSIVLFMMILSKTFDPNITYIFITMLILIGALAISTITLLKLNQSIFKMVNYSVALFAFILTFVSFFLCYENNRMAVIIASILGIIAGIIGFKIEGHDWKRKLEVWKANGKMDIENHVINIFSPWYVPKPKQNLKKLSYISATMVAIVLSGLSAASRHMKNSALESNLIPFVLLIFTYGLGIFLKRVWWMYSYQKENKIIFYNELGENYDIKELFGKKKKREKRKA